MKKNLIVLVGLLFCTFTMTHTAMARHHGPLFAVQKKLLSLGYDPGPVDGQMGHKTERAIRRFQHDHGLRATGRMDPRTEDKLMHTPAGPPVKPGRNIPHQSEPAHHRAPEPPPAY